MQNYRRGAHTVYDLKYHLVWCTKYRRAAVVGDVGLMQRIKGKTSYKLLGENKRLNKLFWGRHLWARGYFACTSGNVTDEAIMAYIAAQETTPDSEFRVHDAP